MDKIFAHWLTVTPEEQWPYLDDGGNPLQRLDGIGKVNIFVGPNNGGKSRLVRSLARQATYSFGVGRDELSDLTNWLATSSAELTAQWVGQQNLAAVGAINPESLQRAAAPTALSSSSDSLKDLRDLVLQFAHAGSGSASMSIRGGSYGQVPSHLLRLFNKFSEELSSRLQRIDQIDVKSLAPGRKVYIPVLRSLRHMGGADLFGTRTTTEYFQGASNGPQVFTGLSLYEEVKAHLLGPREHRQRIREYERFLATKIFDVRDVALIPRTDSDVLFVKIGDEPERPVHHLGDGIQSVIILTFQLFANDHTWFFIEEPELFLHPGLQRKLLNLLLSDSNSHRTFLTTHSNHFLDMSLDYGGVAVYGISRSHAAAVGDEREARFTVELLDSADQSALSLLGVRNSSVFLVNATIWVEGITDRFYVRRLLELYQDTLPEGQWRADEDIHFSFVEYGGGNVVHFAFADQSQKQDRIVVERLCGRAIVIADHDAGKKSARLTEMRSILKDRLIVLPVREIENLLPWNILSKVIASYESCNATTLDAPKASDLHNKPLGTLFDEKVLGGNPQRKGGYSEPSGTLKAKPEFCERALQHMGNPAMLDDLPAEARAMLRTIYEFLRSRNQDAVELHGIAIG